MQRLGWRHGLHEGGSRGCSRTVSLTLSPEALGDRQGQPQEEDLCVEVGMEPWEALGKGEG